MCVPPCVSQERRPDGAAKVRGDFAYSSDLRADGMLWGATARSPHPYARIASIDTTEARAMPGVHAVLTYADVPGRNLYGLEIQDQPVLAHDVVRYWGEAVALVAADHPEHSAEGLSRRRRPGEGEERSALCDKFGHVRRVPGELRRVVGRRVRLKTSPEVGGRKNFRGEVRDATERDVTLGINGDDVHIPYEAIVRGNLIDEG